MTYEFGYMKWCDKLVIWTLMVHISTNDQIMVSPLDGSWNGERILNVMLWVIGCGNSIIWLMKVGNKSNALRLAYR